MEECPFCGGKPGDVKQKVDMEHRAILVGEGVEITINQQGDYLARKKE